MYLEIDKESVLVIEEVAGCSTYMLGRLTSSARSTCLIEAARSIMEGKGQLQQIFMICDSRLMTAKDI